MAGYEICEKCEYTLLHPSFLVCPICGHRREPEPFVVTFGVTLNSVSENEAEKRAQELLELMRQNLGPDSNGWIEGVDLLSESEKMDQYTNEVLNGEDEE